MLRRINLSRNALLALGAVALLGLAMTPNASAATLSPATLERAAAGKIAGPVHCKSRRHFHKRCRYCRREYHTCQKKR